MRGGAGILRLDSLSEPPGWALRLVRHASASDWQERDGELSIRWIAHDEFSLVSVRVHGAVSMSALRLQRATVAAYESVASRLAGLAARHPVRIWNFIPSILEPMGDLPHRYMVFNAGRFAAYAKRHALEDFRYGLVAASAVGHFGEDLLVHCLAASRAGEPMENPRQVPAWRYARQYGPMPPCFARATCLGLSDGRRLLFASGTASIAGEDTVHPCDLAAQSEETLKNLAALVPLDQFRKLRVYFVHEHHAPQISRLVRRQFEGADEVEYTRAQLCRPDLLIEIEGYAEMNQCDPQRRPLLRPVSRCP